MIRPRDEYTLLEAEEQRTFERLTFVSQSSNSASLDHSLAFSLDERLDQLLTKHFEAKITLTEILDSYLIGQRIYRYHKPLM